jgi:hypothetical protein
MIQAARELVVVIFLPRDGAIAVFVAIRFAFIALVVGAAHERGVAEGYNVGALMLIGADAILVVWVA